MTVTVNYCVLYAFSEVLELEYFHFLPLKLLLPFKGKYFNVLLREMYDGFVYSMNKNL